MPTRGQDGRASVPYGMLVPLYEGMRWCGCVPILLPVEGVLGWGEAASGDVGLLEPLGTSGDIDQYPEGVSPRSRKLVCWVGWSVAISLRVI